MNNKNTKIKIILLILVVFIIIGATSFALWQQTRKQTTKNAMGLACLEVTKESETDGITIKEAWPKTDLEASSLDSYSITVKNRCNNSINYLVALEKIKDSSVPNNDDYLNSNYIRVKVDNKASAILGSLETIDNATGESYTILETRRLSANTLGPNESRTITFKLWMDADTPAEGNAYKHFYGKIRIILGQGFNAQEYAIPDESCFTFDSATGTINNYNNTCGPAILPKSIGGVDIKTIASQAFYYTSVIDLKNVTGLETIDSYAFFNHYGTNTTLIIPDSVKTIGDNAFNHFEGNYLHLGNGVETIGTSCFSRYTGTNQALIIPNSTVTIGGASFGQFNGVDLTIGNSVTTIGNSAFASYTGLGDNLVIPQSVTSIGTYGFNAYKGDSLTLNEGLESIDDYGFYNYNGNNITIPSTIKSIGNSVFYKMDSTKTINVNMTEADFSANVTTGTTWNGNATIHYLDS